LGDFKVALWNFWQQFFTPPSLPFPSPPFPLGGIEYHNVLAITRLFPTYIHMYMYPYLPASVKLRPLLQLVVSATECTPQCDKFKNFVKILFKTLAWKDLIFPKCIMLA